LTQSKIPFEEVVLKTNNSAPTKSSYQALIDKYGPVEEQVGQEDLNIPECSDAITEDSDSQSMTSSQNKKKKKNLKPSRKHKMVKNQEQMNKSQWFYKKFRQDDQKLEKLIKYSFSSPLKMNELNSEF
jgi:hypothetical protein